MMKDWQKLILLYFAGRKTPATPKNIEQRLKKHDISKSLTAIKTACQESLSSFMICHDHSTYNDDGTVRQPRFKYSLKPDPDTLTKLLDTFVGTKYEFMFLQSFYVQDLDPYDLEIHKAIVLTFIHHMEAAQLMLNLFYPGLSLTKELNTSLAPSTSDGVAEKLATQQKQRICDLMSNMMEFVTHAREVGYTLPPHSTVADLMRKLDEECS